jgi:hypothetical protein
MRFLSILFILSSLRFFLLLAVDLPIGWDSVFITTSSSQVSSVDEESDYSSSQNSSPIVEDHLVTEDQVLGLLKFDYLAVLSLYSTSNLIAQNNPYVPDYPPSYHSQI